MFGFGRKSIAEQNIRELKETASKQTRAGRWQRALPSLQAIVERQPDDPQHRIRLGECLKRLGKTGEARQQWLRAAKGWADDAQWEKATGACRVALAEDPNDEGVLRLLRVLQNQRQRTYQRTPRQAGAAEEDLIEVEIEGWSAGARAVGPAPPMLPFATDPQASSG